MKRISFVSTFPKKSSVKIKKVLLFSLQRKTGQDIARSVWCARRGVDGNLMMMEGFWENFRRRDGKNVVVNLYLKPVSIKLSTESHSAIAKRAGWKKKSKTKYYHLHIQISGVIYVAPTTPVGNVFVSAAENLFSFFLFSSAANLLWWNRLFFSSSGNDCNQRRVSCWLKSCWNRVIAWLTTRSGPPAVTGRKRNRRRRRRMKGCGMGEKMERAAIRHTHTQNLLLFFLIPFQDYFMFRGEKRFK